MNKIRTIILSIVFSMIISFFLLGFLGKKINVQLYNYVNSESKRLVSNVVNYSVNKVIEENIEDDLFEITKNKRGEIELLDYNTKEVNKLLKIVNQRIQNELLKLEEGKIKEFAIAQTFKNGRFKDVDQGIICEVPLGITKNNIFFSNFGPYIPIKMSFLGSVSSHINTKISSYGFNSLVLEVTMIIEIEEKITMPISSKITKVVVKSPITLKVIQGIIPEYYYTKGLEKSSNQYVTKD